MRLNTKPVTVAIADTDRDRRMGLESFLLGEVGIELLSNSESDNKDSHDHAFVERRLKHRADITADQNEVAKIKRLKPHVLLVNLNLCTEEDYAFFLSLRRECPEPLVVLLADDSSHESQIFNALKIGARGYLKYESIRHHLSMAIRVVSRGEAWVPRKMLSNIMDYMLLN